MFATTNSRTHGSMPFVETTKIGANEEKSFYSKLSEKIEGAMRMNNPETQATLTHN